MISGNVDGMSLRKVGGHTSSFPKLGCGLSRNLGGGDRYRQYLHRFGSDDSGSLNCPRCLGIPKDPEHVMCQCPSFAMERGNLNQALRGSVSRKNLVTEMLRAKENWLSLQS